MAFSEVIKDARAAKGWTREHLAVYAGVSASTVGRIERHEHRPRRAVVLALARALDLPLDAITAEIGPGHVPAWVHKAGPLEGDK